MNKERSVRVVVGLRKHVDIPVAVNQQFGDTDLVLINGVRGLLPYLHGDAMRPLKNARDHAVQAWNVLPVDRAHVLPGDAEPVFHPPEQCERV